MNEQETTEQNDENIKKIMFLMRKAPHGSIYSYEGLETVLIVAAYDQDVTMAFIGDGVFALVKDQDTDDIGIKGFIKTYPVLEQYEIEKVYVDRQSMTERGLTVDDFAIDVIVKDSDEIATLIEDQHAVISY
ncbi:MAG TPA: sulfurtransferase complex subunit TusC [Nitrospinota bacterium]|nr:sulfurtransferase complex subunit TusC [Nitrospinota bacterium]|tara:strand:- start:6915 stop:7310 length:396 start_codon:yes stop_codon:yes gene_type:complete